jgi:hypothetical protein
MTHKGWDVSKTMLSPSWDFYSNLLQSIRRIISKKKDEINEDFSVDEEAYILDEFYSFV